LPKYNFARQQARLLWGSVLQLDIRSRMQ